MFESVFWNRHRDAAQRTAVVVLAAILVCLAALTLPRLVVSETAVVKIDMRVSGGGRAELYINDMTLEPRRADLVAGERIAYEFEDIHRDITVLRLDPGSSPGSEIEIYGVSVEDESGVLWRFVPRDVAGWALHNVEALEVTDDAVRLIAKSNDPILVSHQRIDLNRQYPGFVSEAARGLSVPRSVQKILVIGFLATLLIGLLDGRRAHLVVAGVAAASACGAIYLAARVYTEPTPADVAVGRATFVGQSIDANMFGTAGALVLALAVGWLLAIAINRTRRQNPSTPRVVEGHAAARRSWLVPLLVTVGLVLYFAPEARAILANMTNGQYRPDWDGNNVLVWAYLAHEGYLPLRDFWYPYGGFFAENLPAPYGFVIRAAQSLIVYAGFFFAVYTLSGRRALISVGVLVMVMVGEADMVYWGAYRYLMAISVLLSYLAIDSAERRIQGAHLWFWGLCALALFFEPVQLVYAAPGVAARLAFDLYHAGPRRFDGLGLRLAREFGVPTLCAIVAIGAIVAAGMGAGALDFYLGLGDQATASATPTNLLAGLARPLTVQWTIILLPMVFVALGGYEQVRGKNAELRRFGSILMGLGLLGFMLITKHQVRPADWQLFIIPALGIVAYLAFTPYRRSLCEYLGLGAVAGLYLAVTIASGSLETHLRHWSAGPARVAALVHVVSSESALIGQARAERFSPDRFTHFADERAAATMIAEEMSGSSDTPAYVLTDNAVIYILLGVVPPYHVNGYNASPIYEQRKVTEWLERERPRFAVFDPTMLEFDGVPNSVRVPLLYSAVIENYVPHKRAGRLHILRRRAPGEPVDFAFWLETLGTSIRLGHLPSVSSFADYVPCDPQTACQDFLSVQLGKPGGTITIPLLVGTQIFDISFESVAGQPDYHISLDRLWLWNAAREEGLPVSLAPEKMADGVTAMMVQRKARSDLLY